MNSSSRETCTVPDKYARRAQKNTTSEFLCYCAEITHDEVRKQINKTPQASFEEIKTVCNLAQHCQACEPDALKLYSKMQAQMQTQHQHGKLPSKRSLIISRILRNFHLFSSLIAAVFLLFFAFSGYVMNHRDEYGLDDVKETTLQTPLPPKLKEHLKKQPLLEWCQSQGARGDLAEYIQEDDSILITYVCAGQRFEAEIDTTSYNASILIQKNSFLETLGEIHRSPSADDSSPSLFIDVMAFLMATVSLSGIFLFFRMATRKNKFALLLFVLSIATATGIYLKQSGAF